MKPKKTSKLVKNIFFVPGDKADILKDTGSRSLYESIDKILPAVEVAVHC